MTYRDCGYKYMIQPRPTCRGIISGENPSGVAFAYT